ncbi:MAG: hypothetical protein RJA61_130 [Candidatus Parcubacteria bacterium]|jgi:HAD superfamily hydrolase (TIGR01490 family)
MHKIAIFDIDGTLIKEQSQKLFLHFLLKKKIIGYFFFLRIYIWFIFYKLHIVKNPRVVMDKVALFLKGKSVVFVKDTTEAFFNSVLMSFFDKNIVDILYKKRDARYRVILVSNAFDFLVSRISEYLQVTDFLATKPEIKNGFFTGHLEHVMYGENKVTHLNEFLNIENIKLTESFVYTDHHSDLLMLELVDNPVLVNPDKILMKIGEQRGWEIINT